MDWKMFRDFRWSFVGLGAAIGAAMFLGAYYLLVILKHIH